MVHFLACGGVPIPPQVSDCSTQRQLTPPLMVLPALPRVAW